jgi:hypothetical protein
MLMPHASFGTQICLTHPIRKIDFRAQMWAAAVEWSISSWRGNFYLEILGPRMALHFGGSFSDEGPMIVPVAREI